jgi:site-specific DNA-methyltransferase (adenine-specific)
MRRPLSAALEQASFPCFGDSTPAARMMTTLTSTPLALDYKHHRVGRASLIVHADCFEWMSRIPKDSLHAIVTDPPYGVKEYDFDQIEKRTNGNGGIWRIPPSFDGNKRAPLPRFTALNPKERQILRRFFLEWAKVAVHALRPGGHVLIASNSFLCQLVFEALSEGGLEFRGQLVRLVRSSAAAIDPRMLRKSSQEFPQCREAAMSRGESYGSRCCVG